MPGAVVELTPEEQDIARLIAAARYDSNRASNVSNNRVGPQSDAETDLQGIGGEMAFCRLFNLYPDFTIMPRVGGYDCEAQAIAIDVKTTKYVHGALVAVPTKRIGQTDYFALMVGEFPRYRFAGFARESDLLHRDNITTLGHGPTYALEQRQLTTAMK